MAGFLPPIDGSATASCPTSGTEVPPSRGRARRPSKVEEHSVLPSMDGARQSVSETVKDVFRAFDRNGDGVIQKSELESVLQQLSGCSGAELDALLLSADKNKNGVLEYDEFVDWIFSAKGAPLVGPEPPVTAYFGNHGLEEVFRSLREGLDRTQPVDPLIWMMQHLGDLKRLRDAADVASVLTAADAAKGAATASGGSNHAVSKSKNPNAVRVNISACLKKGCKALLNIVLGGPNYVQVEDAQDDRSSIYFVWDGKSLLSRLAHPAAKEALPRLPDGSWINRLPGMGTLCDKVNMALALRLLQKLWPKRFKFWPKSWLLPAETDKLREWLHAHKSETVIVKPADGSQGDGIFLCKDPSDLDAKLLAKPSWGAGFGALAQKYVPNPLCLDGLKFDLRLYVVVTSLDPVKAYLCREGLARFCTAKYEAPTQTNQNQMYMHLANYSVNKRSRDYQSDDDFMSATTKATKRPLSTLLSQLAVHEAGQGRVFDENRFFSSCGEVVAVLLQSIMPVLKVTYDRVSAEAHKKAQAAKSKPKAKAKPRARKGDSDESDESVEESQDSQENFEPGCFQILGVDVLLDDRLQPWLLEVNARPSMDIDSSIRLEDAPEGSRRCVCRDMDGMEHCHVPSPVDVFVKSKVLEGAFQLLGSTSEHYIELDFDSHGPSEAQETLQTIARIYQVAEGSKRNAFTTLGVRRALAGAISAGLPATDIDALVSKWKHQGYRDDVAAEDDQGDIAVLDFAGLLQELALIRSGHDSDPLEALTDLIDLCDPELS